MSSEKHTIIFFILYLINLLYFITFNRIFLKDTSQEPKRIYLTLLRPSAISRKSTYKNTAAE